MKKCKDCKKDYEPRYRNGIAVPRCDKCTIAKEREKKKKALERAKERKKKARERKKNSVSALKKELDIVFSRYIRQRDKGICISCGSKKPWKEQQNGHYIKRSAMNTRYDEQNCHCQCVGCNIFKKGNYPDYTLAIQQKYGYDIVEDLVARGREIKQWTATELKELIAHYKQKLTEF